MTEQIDLVEQYQTRGKNFDVHFKPGEVRHLANT